MVGHRFGVRSADGTPLAVWTDGHGPPLVLGHGSMCDHTAFDPLAAELRDTMTTYSMDRRGFGASGDAAIPGARVQVLDGHAHLAYRSDPAMVAAAIQRFVSG